jgi:polysaccharide export outer membrane protein
MNRRVIFAAALVLFSAGMPLASQQDKHDKAKETMTASARSSSGAPNESRPAPATTDPDYVIGPADMLDISVWKEPDVSRAVPVRPDGKISLPLIDDVQAAGQTPLQLAGLVTEKLTKYLKAPQVTIVVTQINSQRVFVVGEVARVGALQLLPGMTVLQALASAGGFTPFADMKKIRIVRTRNGKQIEYPFNYRDALKGEKPEQNIKMEPGDMIVVP